jgi:hypothetical protein
MKQLLQSKLMVTYFQNILTNISFIPDKHIDTNSIFFNKNISQLITVNYT